MFTTQEIFELCGYNLNQLNYFKRNGYIVPEKFKGQILLYSLKKVKILLIISTLTSVATLQSIRHAYHFLDKTIDNRISTHKYLMVFNESCEYIDDCESFKRLILDKQERGEKLLGIADISKIEHELNDFMENSEKFAVV